MSDVIRVRRKSGSTTIYASLANLARFLSVDDEAALLGFIHYYLASWISRTQRGEARPPIHWPRIVYEYVPGSYVELPVLGAEVQMVRRTLQRILGLSESRTQHPPVGTGQSSHLAIPKANSRDRSGGGSHGGTGA